MAKKKGDEKRPRKDALRIFERALKKALNTPPETPRVPKKKKAKRRK